MKKATDIINEIIKEELPMITDGKINCISSKINEKLSLDNLMIFDDNDLKESYKFNPREINTNYK